MGHAIKIVLASMIVAVIGVYLVGLRLEARFAGGQGRLETCGATPLDQTGPTILRGQIMSSGNDFSRYQLCDGTMLYLDVNTEIKLNQYRFPANYEETQLQLVQGRVIVDGVADVHARNVGVALRGAGCELVHYSWLDELDITPLVDSACQIIGSDALPQTLSTTRYDTFTTSIKNNLRFSPETSSAQNFYVWTGLEFKGLR